MKIAGERHDEYDFFIYMGYVIHTSPKLSFYLI